MGLGAAKPQYGAILAGNEARPEGAKGAAPGGAAVAFGFLAAVVGGNGVYGAWKMSRSALLCYHVAATVLIIGLLYSASLALLYRSAAIDILRSGSGEGDEKGGIEDAEASLRGLGASFIASFVLLLITLVAGAEVMGWRFTLSRLGGATHFAGVLSGILLLTLCAALAGWKEYKVKDAVTIDMSISPKPKVDPLIDDTTRVFNATMDGVTPGAVWFHRDSLSFPDGSISFTVSFFGPTHALFLAFSSLGESIEKRQAKACSSLQVSRIAARGRKGRTSSLEPSKMLSKSITKNRWEN